MGYHSIYLGDADEGVSTMLLRKKCKLPPKNVGKQSHMNSTDGAIPKI
jgi:hypothetical protein